MPRTLLISLSFLVALATLALASSGDRNPTFQHCLKGCELTYCDPSQPPIPLYLRVFGWSCTANCAYSCAHSFTDNIRPGSRYHQFYGKWAFYRLGPIQEPFSVLMSLGNFWVHLKGLEEVRRRVRRENKLRRWLEALAIVQCNTWVWSAVFHSRDSPLTERLDYFSATLTIGLSLLYTLIRTLHLQTPLGSSRLLFPVSAVVACLVLAHFTYLLSFDHGSFPYGYHTQFNVVLALVHSTLWILWSLSFYIYLPTLPIGRFEIGLPVPYPPTDPLKHRTKDSSTPLALTLLTFGAMSLELLDFPPFVRLVDAHALWHLSTIPLALAWWTFLPNDAIELEGVMLNNRGVSVVPEGEKPLSGGAVGAVGAPKEGESIVVPATPTYAQLAAGSAGQGTRARSPGRTPKGEKPE